MEHLSRVLDSLKEHTKSTQEIFLPEMVRLPNDNARFTQILAVPGIFVVDEIKDQVREWLKCSAPSHRWKEGELDTAATQTLGRHPEEYGTWVYYPWSKRLVHLLSRDEFILVRTSRNRNKITAGEQALLEKKSIGVIGLSVGQSVSVTLAMERICGEIRLADFDLLELTNLNRIRTGVHNLGLPKVYSVAREIAEIDPYLKVVCFPEGLTENNMDEFFLNGGQLDLLIEESDGFDIKILSRYKARSLRIPVLMEASDRCMVDVERFDLEPDREILHGLVKELDVAKLKSLKTNEEKIPYMLDVLGMRTTSPRLKASMLEINRSITTWPQLASAVTMGGGITADVARRLLLGYYRSSGRFYVDIEELIGDEVPVKTEKAEPESMPSFVKPKNNSEMHAEDIRKLIHGLSARTTGIEDDQWQFKAEDGYLVARRTETWPGFPGEIIELYQHFSEERLITDVSRLASRMGFKATSSYLCNTAGMIMAFSFNRSGERSAVTLTIDELLKQSGQPLPFANGTRELDLVASIAGEAEWFRLFHEGISVGMRKAWSDEKNRLFDARSAYGELPNQMVTVMDALTDPRVAKHIDKWDAGSAVTDYFKAYYAGAKFGGVICGEVTSDIGKVLSEMDHSVSQENLIFQSISLPLYLTATMRHDSTGKMFSENQKNRMNKIDHALQDLKLTGRPLYLYFAMPAKNIQNSYSQKVTTSAKIDN